MDGAPAFHYEIGQFGGQWTWGWEQVHVEGQPVTPSRSAPASTPIVFGSRDRFPAWTPSSWSTLRLRAHPVHAVRHDANGDTHQYAYIDRHVQTVAHDPYPNRHADTDANGDSHCNVHEHSDADPDVHRHRNANCDAGTQLPAADLASVTARRTDGPRTTFSPGSSQEVGNSPCLSNDGCSPVCSSLRSWPRPDPGPASRLVSRRNAIGVQRLYVDRRKRRPMAHRRPLPSLDGPGVMWLANDAIWITLLDASPSNPDSSGDDLPSPLSSKERGDGQGRGERFSASTSNSPSSAPTRSPHCNHRRPQRQK